MEYDDDDKYIGSSGDARLHDMDMEYDTDNICIDSSGDARYCTAVPTILLNNCINYCKSDCYERKNARWISESDFVL